MSNPLGNLGSEPLKGQPPSYTSPSGQSVHKLNTSAGNASFVTSSGGESSSSVSGSKGSTGSASPDAVSKQMSALSFVKGVFGKSEAKSKAAVEAIQYAMQMRDTMLSKNTQKQLFGSESGGMCKDLMNFNKIIAENKKQLTGADLDKIKEMEEHSLQNELCTNIKNNLNDSGGVKRRDEGLGVPTARGVPLTQEERGKLSKIEAELKSKLENESPPRPYPKGLDADDFTPDLLALFPGPKSK